MKVLAFDSSAGACSAAILGADGAILAHRSRMLARGHAEVLMPMVQEVLAGAALDFSTLDLLAVTTGPGTFTGIRIGLAAARGLALASGLPLIGVTSLEAAAAGVAQVERTGRMLLVTIDSRRDDLFIQAFDHENRPLSPPASVASGDLARSVPAGALLIAGDAAARACDVLAAAGRPVALASAVGPPDAIHVAQLARARWRPGQPEPLPQPTYLRAPDVTRPHQALRAPR